MVETITSAVGGILSCAITLLTPTAVTGESGTASAYTHILALVCIAAVFAVSRRTLKKIR